MICKGNAAALSLSPGGTGIVLPHHYIIPITLPHHRRERELYEKGPGCPIAQCGLSLIKEMQLLSSLSTSSSLFLHNTPLL
jgi:hypothetical protein